MEPESEFNCIFCNEPFDNKELLQVHFRKHGDPKFNELKKVKYRPQLNDVKPTACETEETLDTVGCDVCDEKFPSISKAITHKHKVHPDHDTKYFCPWCGKLFTLKHLYSKHIMSTHEADVRTDDIAFRCDCCVVDFYVPNAMLYHNKFFHRQDTELAAIGHSIKQKLVKQELLPVYYCPFCGEEYINKVNLLRHISDDHNDENQNPEDILRCPLCKAVFYHLDAYQLHLTFHTSEDIVTEGKEISEEGNPDTEISLETVPPVMEKVENDEENEPVGIEHLLDFAMDESNDESKKKSKKHKKHKKSKKSAITLDEFFNMNKDVFGDGIDFQGVEEVPTKVVKKQLQPKRVAPANASKQQLNKLAKLGIVVKKNTSLPASNVKTLVQTAKLPDSKINKNVEGLVKIPTNEVIAKFMNHSQIKILKKADDCLPAQEETCTNNQNPDDKDFTGVESEDVSNNKSDNSVNDIDKNEVTNNGSGNANKICFENEKEVVSDQQVKSQSQNENTNKPMEFLKNLSHLTVKSNITPENNNSKVTDKKDTINKSNHSDFDSSDDIDTHNNMDHDDTFQTPVEPVKKIKISENIVNENQGGTYDVLKNISKHITVKSNAIQPHMNNSDEDNFDNDDQDFDLNTTTTKFVKVSPRVKLQSLKPVTKLLSEEDTSTPKPVKDETNKLNVKILPQLKNITARSIKTEKFFDQNDDEIEILNIDDSDSDDQHTNIKPVTKEIPTLQNKDTLSNLNTFKNISKNITIKSMSSSPKDNIESCINNDHNNKSINKNIIVNTKIKTPDTTLPDTTYNDNQNKSKTLPDNALQNKLKNLSKNLTVKSKNATQQQYHFSYNFSDDENDILDMPIGKVKITEITDEQLADEDSFSKNNSNSDSEKQIVKYTSEGDGDNDEHFDDNNDDFEKQIKVNTLKVSKPQQKLPIDNLKNMNKQLTIKSLPRNVPEDEFDLDQEDLLANNESQKSNTKEIAKPSQIKNTNKIQCNQNTSVQNTNQVKINKNLTTSNKEVSVKRFESNTFVEEITTTVTKTIRTINQTVKQNTNSRQANVSKPQQPKIIQNFNQKNLQGTIVRQATPRPRTNTQLRFRNPTPKQNEIRPQVAVGTSNQIVPFRARAPTAQPRPRLNTAKLSTPRMPFSPGAVSKPLKISPSALNSLKRSATEDNSYNVKKQMSNVKNVTIPMDDFGDSSQFSASHTQTSTMTSSSKVIKGNSVVMSKQTKTESASQHLNKLNNLSGIKIMKTSQTKQVAEFEERNDAIPTQNTTLDAIERLKKQGLLVKKPRIESDHSNDDDFGDEMMEQDEDDFF